MTIRRLDIRGLRNLDEIRITELTRINIFIGSNGAGKTSLLEAIYLLGMGRSFRSHKTATIVSHGKNTCTLYAEFQAESISRENELYAPFRSIGIIKSRNGEQEARLDQRAASAMTELAAALPMQLINTDSFLLINGSPKARRQFLDWGVFHVKHDFFDAWRRAQRCLKQRTAALRRQIGSARDRMVDSVELMAWDKDLSDAARIIDTRRCEYIEAIVPIFSQVMKRLSAELPTISVIYRRGWRDNISLSEALIECRARDIKYAVSTVGPHRANLEITIDGKLATEVLSRGQQKLIVSALRLAQGQYFMECTGRQCIYLIDDLPAELDKQHRSAFCAILDEMKCQVFMTAVEEEQLNHNWICANDVSLFHVEHGSIKCNPHNLESYEKAIAV